jgi:DNA repair exonuclease SbcCD ATPase subunit
MTKKPVASFPSLSPVAPKSPASSGEDELFAQWDFLDAMVERQATSLRSGIQDPEESEEELQPPVNGEIEELRSRVAALEKEKTTLQKQVAIANGQYQKLVENARHDTKNYAQELKQRQLEINRLNKYAKELLASLRQAHQQIQAGESTTPPAPITKRQSRRRWWQR